MLSSSELLLAFQLCDSAFPGGSLANSQGLESALQHGFVDKNSVDSLNKYLLMSMEQVISVIFH